MIINIDHHPGNAMYGDINIVDPENQQQPKYCDIIVKGFPELLDYNISLGIYTAILTDTGRFQYSNTTHSVHRIASHLLELGWSRQRYFHAYMKMSRSEGLNCWQKCLKG